MVELVGDPCVPSILIVPLVSGAAGAQPTISGAIYMSGTNLYFYNGVRTKII